MTEGQTLAAELKRQLTEVQEDALEGKSEEFLAGFLYGRFGKFHSMVALYNAAAQW